MEHNFKDNETLSITQAILIYSNSSRKVCLLSNVVGGEIQPGSPINREMMIEVLKSDAQPESNPSGYFKAVDNNLIAESPDHWVWWRKASVVDTFLNGSPMKVWHPNLIFCGSKSKCDLYVWATGDKRPSIGSVIYRYMLGHHLDNNGRMCLGSAKPTAYTPVNWEDAFFNSSKTSKEGFTEKPYGIKTLQKIGQLKDTLDKISWVQAHR